MLCNEGFSSLGLLVKRRAGQGWGSCGCSMFPILGVRAFSWGPVLGENRPEMKGPLGSAESLRTRTPYPGPKELCTPPKWETRSPLTAIGFVATYKR